MGCIILGANPMGFIGIAGIAGVATAGALSGPVLVTAASLESLVGGVFGSCGSFDIAAQAYHEILGH